MDTMILGFVIFVIVVVMVSGIGRHFVIFQNTPGGRKEFKPE